MITPDTVDADIYERCLLRIGVFEQALGESEEILGRITRDIQQIAINPNLSDEERREQLQQLADNEIRQLQEDEKFEAQQSELFGIDLPSQQRFAEEVQNASSYWLEPSAMNNLIEKYLSSLNGAAAILGDSPLKTLRTNQDIRSQMLRDARQLSGKNSALGRDWERWLKGNDPHLAITFDGQCANDNRTAQLLTPVHPLIRQAANALDSVGNVEVHLRVTDSELPVGIHPFAVFQWELIGLRRESTKGDDFTQIGRFGIGFKSVYAFTKSPVIHCGDEHFQIKNYVRPYAVARSVIEKPWTTLIIIPFDKGDVTSAVAVAEIANRLRCLSARTLLFLARVSEIEYRVVIPSRASSLSKSRSEHESASILQN